MKKKRNRWLYTCMALLFVCIAQIHTANAAASPSLSASADAAKVAKGDHVNVSINLSGNPTVSTLGMALGYDSSVLSYDSVSWNGGFSGGDMKMASDTGSEVNLSVVCENSYSANGTVATIRFQAVSDSSAIPVTLSLRDMADGDLEEVTDCKVSGKVRVPEAADDKSNKKESDSDGEDVLEVPGTDETSNTAEASNATETPDADGMPNTTESPNADGTLNAAETPNTASAPNATGASNTVTVNAQQAASSDSQNTSVQIAKAASASGTGSSKPDQSYKTGAGFGNDIFLLIAAACGVLALALLVFKRREEEK